MKGVVLEGQRLPGSWAGAPGPAKSRSRLIVASNRLPVVLGKDAEGRWSVKPGSGGLITALVPVLQERGGTADGRVLTQGLALGAFRLGPGLFGLGLLPCGDGVTERASCPSTNGN